MKEHLHQDLLLEIGTEELPAKEISILVSSFANNLVEKLKLLSLEHREVKTFSTPRRLAILIHNLTTKQPEQILELRGPPVTVAFDQLGQPTKAALKFSQSCKVELAQLKTIKEPKGEFLFYKESKAGVKTIELLPEIVIESIKKIPLKKGMRWGNNLGPFARPIHWLVAMFGKEVIPLEIFSILSSCQTRGHRFHHPEPIPIPEPKEYERLLLERCSVIADSSQRENRIQKEIAAIVKTGVPMVTKSLLAEVVNLVEWPVVLVGSFQPRFLQLPKEVLISTMENHQRYFSIADQEGALLPNFIIISNIKSNDPPSVILGNERVIQARLTDAEYFYEQDRKEEFAKNLEKLKSVTFQEKLGTLYDKTIRLEKLAFAIAKKIKVDSKLVQRAATLSKCDLVTMMVGEFPELQGVMGYYCALTKEHQDVALAIKEQYLPRFAADKTPATKAGAVLALADRLDNLVAFFAIKKIPTGDKDPFGLRRTATGIIKIILEQNLSLDLKELLYAACLPFEKLLTNQKELINQILAFIFERFRFLSIEQGQDHNIFSAVLSTNPTSLQELSQKAAAIEKFYRLPEAENLILIYKRITNLLGQATQQNSDKSRFNPAFAKESAEHELFKAVAAKKTKLLALAKEQKYFECLSHLVKLKPKLDEFFLQVMVMTDDAELRNNRLTLLKEIQTLFLIIADLSCLVSGKKSST